MTRCFFHLDASDIPSNPSQDELHTHLYGGKAPKPGTVAIGNQVRDLFLRLGVQPSTRAVDLVSIALAVTAADTFVLRDETDTGWSRQIEIYLPLLNPEPWKGATADLSRTLGFLSGDSWTFEFLPGGEEPPAKAAIARHQPRLDVSSGDSVSLFSGGLDSTVYALTAIKKSERPILVSHGYTGDKEVQNDIVGKLPKRLQHASVNAWPNSDLRSDISMRTRSFLFLAIAALVCDVRSRLSGGALPLFVPENGLIALNAPLTPRRIGSNSTRTTHPYYLMGMQSIFDAVGIPAAIKNPFELLTKGEMVAGLSDDGLFRILASETVSCGKWKRDGMQCGRCVPCLIRRASLYAGNVDDQTQYQSPDLAEVLGKEDHRDDLVAMMTAVRRLETNNLERWVAQSGPLPTGQPRRDSLVDVCRRGILEVGRYLSDSGLRL
ncbi:MAG: hypothetical protein EOQ54_28720 [Mesorhizobium sp.]|nr:MAG: hypothetical protein EOQ54_28720 [Mesorhizobium sp.]RWG94303.1 MAG: hypothetical protein EOQ72_27865 [Mesorhizobium sp.]TIR89651.1 MAG: hypothetical protein E5X08_26650 [Mesorhizobium sp.]